MKLELRRFSSQSESTLGNFFVMDEHPSFLCFTLENEFQAKKVAGETRIPAGTYQLGLRTEGGFNDRYKSRFPDIHKGMLHLLDVPNFEYILIHCGNTEADTAGCILVGDSVTQNVSRDGLIANSVDAYKRIYPSIADALVQGQKVSISILDFS